jgi:glycosyltransferase involved in cell wall biosynthesis
MSCRIGKDLELIMRPLKIALLSREYWLESEIHYDQEGGAIRQLAEAVAALGHEVVVLSQSSEVRKLRKVKIGTLETWVSPREKHGGLIAALRDRAGRKTYSYHKVYSDTLALREFLARRGPFDVLWAHDQSPDGLIAAMAAQRGVKLPPVLLQLQGLPCRFEKGAPVFTDRLPISLAFRQAKRILAPSEMIVDCLSGYACPGLSAADLQAKVHVVPPNLQRAFFQAAQEGPTAPMKDRVLFLGALNRRKGASVFLKAIPKTEASKKISTFAIIGDFTEYNRRFIRRWEEAKETMRAQLTGARVEYLGRVSSFEVLRQIKLASVVVIPSLFDGFSRALVEALILGRPVITTDKVGAHPLVQTHQCGIVIPANDPDALARAIDLALNPSAPFAANAQRVGRNLIHEFSPETIALQIARHLYEIAAPEK